MWILFHILLHLIVRAEARVFCHDANATPWLPRGYSCPVKCDNIITAVKALKKAELTSLVLKKYKSPLDNPSDKAIDKNYNKLERSRRHKPIALAASEQLKKLLLKVLPRNEFVEDLYREIKMASRYTNGGTSVSHTKGPVKEFTQHRRTIEYDNFIKEFTLLLNRYIDPKYHLSENSAAILLEILLTRNSDLRHGMYDVRKILSYLEDIITNRGSVNDDIMRLKSRHCLTTYVPGCFCLRGYVENSGRCVRPAECFPGDKNSKYLAKMIVY